MPSFLPVLASASINGRPILVAASGSPGTALHTGVSGTQSMDEVWIWANNNHTGDVNLTIEFGATGVPDNATICSVPYKSGAFLIVPGWRVNNTGVVRAYTSVANVLNCSVNVNRYSLP